MALNQRFENQTPQIALDIKVKGDKFLYYKRRFQMVENTIKIFPFWNNIYIWGFIAFSISTLYFILFLIDKSFHGFAKTINLIQIEGYSMSLQKEFLYLLLLIPAVNFLISLFISYKVYNQKKYLAYAILLISVLSTSLLLTTLIKTIQMHYAIIS